MSSKENRKMPVPKTTIGSRAARVGILLAVTAAAVLGTASPSFAAAPVTLTPSSTQGPSAGGNTITATTPTYTTTTPPVLAPTFFAGTAVEFQVAATSTATCATTYATAVPPSSSTGGIIALPAVNLTIISANRLGITIPTGFFANTSTSAPPKYNICAYNGTTSTSALIAQTATTGQYAIGVQATISSVVPSAGSAQGGTTITVNGLNFPTTSSAITATVGGLPLLNITAVSPTSFTAVTPPHAAGLTALPLSVTTAGGTATKPSAFTFSNGITVSPSTGPNTRAGGTPIDLQGLGFSALTFASTGNPDDTNAHIYLVRGAYDSTLSGQKKAAGEAVECGNVLVVSDTELVCTMNLAVSLDTNVSGTTAMTLHTVTGTTTATSTTLTVTVGALTAADVGQRVSGPGIVDGTTITSQTGTAAVLSLATGTTGVGTGTVTIGAGTAAATVTSGSTALTAVSPALTAADVGRAITGTGIAAGATIVSQTGTAAVLSAPGTSAATGSSSTVTIGTVAPVPVGTYTVTVVNSGAGNLQADPNFTQSIISSGSTFTVSDY
jgi:hypothetical protein